MQAQFKHVPPPREVRSNSQVPTVRGQYHTFTLIPPMEHHTRWFDAGPVSIEWAGCFDYTLPVCHVQASATGHELKYWISGVEKE